MLLPSLFVGHDALGSGNDRDAQPAEHLGKIVGAGVHSEAGLGHPAQAGDDLLLAEILQGDADDALIAALQDLEGLDIPLVQQDLRNGDLQLGMSTVSCRALLAFRIRVSISAIGSVICIC